MNYLGCSGYMYDSWKGLFYPKEIPKNKWFSHYAQNFNTVEINYSFYRLPSEKTVQKWYNTSPNNFRYTLKASRFITHVKKFNDVKEPLKKFYRISSLLKEKLGCILFQFPPSLKYSSQKIQQIIKQLNTEYTNVLEFRHPSWWNMETEDFDLLSEHNIIFCSISAPHLPESIIKTSREIYVRFHGKQWYNYNYSSKELQQWAQRIKEIKSKNAWIYFNNDVNAYAPKNCLQLKKFLEK